jgi:hypothetical protein
METTQARPGWRGGRGTAAVAVVLLCIAGLTAGCSGSGDESSSGDAGSADEAASAGAATDASESGGGAVAESAAVSTDAVEVDATEGRQRTFTANLSLGVDDVDRAVEQAADAVSSIGGFTATAQVDLEDGGQASASYRVPADQFDAALDALGALGEVRTKDVQTDDVTAAYADLESRVAALRTSVERLQGFLAQATDVGQIATIETELTRREADLESTEGQRRALADQVALSTISVSFEPLDEAADDRPTFLAGLDTGRDAAGTVLAAGAATVGFLLPFLPLLLLALMVVVLVRRRRARRFTPSAPASS